MSTYARNLKAGLAALGVAGCLVLVPTGADAAGCTSTKSGGISTSPVTCGPVTRAKLKSNGLAVAPKGAPVAVRDAIAAANKIERKPYVWGGGHGKWWDTGYDCSGSVSYAMHGGGLLSIPYTSGSFEGWGKAGQGRWITTYANSGHVYAVIAGLRWDTSMTPGDGPGWSKQMRSGAGYVSRHPVGY